MTRITKDPASNIHSEDLDRQRRQRHEEAYRRAASVVAASEALWDSEDAIHLPVETETHLAEGVVGASPALQAAQDASDAALHAVEALRSKGERGREALGAVERRAPIARRRPLREFPSTTLQHASALSEPSGQSDQQWEVPIAEFLTDPAELGQVAWTGGTVFIIQELDVQAGTAVYVAFVKSVPPSSSSEPAGILAVTLSDATPQGEQPVGAVMLARNVTSSIFPGTNTPADTARLAITISVQPTVSSDS